MGLAGVLGGVMGAAALSGWLCTVDQSMAWGVALVCSWLGFGRVVHRVLGLRGSVDAGVLAVWGLALTTAVAGPVVAAGVFSKGLGALWTLAGIGAALVVKNGRAVHHRPRFLRLLRRHWPLWVGLAAVWMLTALLYVSGFKRTYYGTDDLNGYLPLADGLVERGDLIQPFSVHRIHAWGGQSVMEALLLVRGDVGQLHGVDMGLAPVMLILLLAGSWRSWRRRFRGLLVAACLVVITLPHTRANLASVMTGTVALLGLLRTMQWFRTHPPTEKARGVLLAMIVMHAVSLRVTYAPAAGLMVLLDGAHRIRRHRGVLQEMAWFSGACLLVGAPWAVALWRSNGTPLFPMMKGHLTDRTNNFERFRTGAALWDWYVLAATSAQSISPWTKALLGAAIIPLAWARRAVQPGHLAFVACLLTSVASVGSYHHSDQGHMDRYLLPFVTVMALAVMQLAGSLRVMRRPVAWIGVALVVTAVALQLPRTEPNARHLREAAEFLPVRAAVKPVTPEPLYRELQTLIPDGEPILAMVDQPAMFDSARNPVFFLDSIGWVAPPPGIPFHDGPEAMRAYFLAQGIHFLVAIDPEAPAWRTTFYGAARWDSAIRNSDHHQHDMTLQREAAFQMKALMVHVKRLGAVRDVWALDLRERAP